MKFPISWHQECLKNKTAHYARERQNAMEALARCDKGDAECAFYERQIAEAQRRKITDFDLDRLMKSNDRTERSADSAGRSQTKETNGH